MQAAYRAGSWRFLLFCETYITQPFPASERVLSGFVAHLHKAGLALEIVKSYLAAVRHSQIALGLGDPYLGNMSMLDYVVKGLKWSYQPGSTWTRPPITLPILRDLRAVWSENAEHHHASMLWAAFCMYFFGFLWVGEIAVPSDFRFDPSSHLAFVDVCADNVVTPHYLEVRIKASKTDPFWQGVSKFLGATGRDVCPVASILSYMVLRGHDSGSFFRFSNGIGLTWD